MSTHSTAKVARELAGDSMKDPEAWLLRKIRAGQIPALKVGRHYRMTDAHVAEAHAVLANPIPRTGGVEQPEQGRSAPGTAFTPLPLSPTSARRMKMKESAS